MQQPSDAVVTWSVGIASYKENGAPGLIAQGLGTSMIQVPNIMRKPLIWLPVILSSAILGPVSTLLFKMTNNATGSGMGTAGLVGQIMTWQTMAVPGVSSVVVLFKILIMHFALPAALTYFFSNMMRNLGWIKDGDMALPM